MTPISWDQITGKPATFPPDAHTHSPDDLVGAGSKFIDLETGDGKGLQVGKVRYDSTGIAYFAIPCLGAATLFFQAVAGSQARLTIVGDDGTNVFIDDVVVSFTAAGGFVATMNNVVGAPRARTYSFTTGLCIALAAPPGPTYNVRAAVQSFL